MNSGLPMSVTGVDVYLGAFYGFCFCDYSYRSRCERVRFTRFLLFGREPISGSDPNATARRTRSRVLIDKPAPSVPMTRLATAGRVASSCNALHRNPSTLPKCVNTVLVETPAARATIFAAGWKFPSFMRSRQVRTILVLMAIERSLRPSMRCGRRVAFLFNVVGLTG